MGPIRPHERMRFRLMRTLGMIALGYGAYRAYRSWRTNQRDQAKLSRSA